MVERIAGSNLLPTKPGNGSDRMAFLTSPPVQVTRMASCLVCQAASSSSRCAECKQPFCSKTCLVKYHSDRDKRSVCLTKLLDRLVEASRHVPPHRRLLVDPSANALQFGSIQAPDIGFVDGEAIWKQLEGALPTMVEGTALMYVSKIGVGLKLPSLIVPAELRLGLRNACDPSPLAPVYGTAESSPVLVIIIERRDVSPATFYRVVVAPLNKRGNTLNIVCQTLFTIQPLGDVLFYIEPIDHPAYLQLEALYIGRQEKDMNGHGGTRDIWETEKTWVDEVRKACLLKAQLKRVKSQKKNRKRRERQKSKANASKDDDVCPLCLDEFGTEATKMLKCCHCFHESCWSVCVEVTTRRQQELLCPMCRGKVE